MTAFTHQEDWKCHAGKKKYLTETDAYRAAQRYMDNFPGTNMEVYKCDVCGFYHKGKRLELAGITQIMKCLFAPQGQYVRA